jgi:hypothetical protein
MTTEEGHLAAGKKIREPWGFTGLSLGHHLALCVWDPGYDTVCLYEGKTGVTPLSLMAVVIEGTEQRLAAVFVSSRVPRGRHLPSCDVKECIPCPRFP